MQNKKQKGEVLDSIFQLLEEQFKINEDMTFTTSAIIMLLNEKETSVRSALIRMREQRAVYFKRVGCSYIYRHKPIKQRHEVARFNDPLLTFNL